MGTSSWRKPRFNLRGLLLLTLLTGLFACVVHDRRRLRRAEGILSANGLQWELPDLAADEYRVTIKQDIHEQRYNFQTIHVQASRPGRLELLGEGKSFTFVELWPGADGAFHGELTVLADGFVGRESSSKLHLR